MKKSFLIATVLATASAFAGQFESNPVGLLTLSSIPTTGNLKLVAMPFDGYAEGSGTSVNVADVLLTDGLSTNDKLYIPTGEIKSVEGTPMDFRTPHALGDSINSQFDQIQNATGYDHNFCLNTYKDGNGDDTQVCASLYSPKTGIFMEMFTNEPGVQVYSGNFQGVGADAKIARKHGLTYPKHVSVCLESQKYPDSPNHPDWVQPILNPGEKYYSHAAYKFSIK